MIFTHDISPIIFTAGPLTVRWYGVLFALGLILNYAMLWWAFKKREFDTKNLDSIAIYLFLGLLIGARLGEVLFYEPSYFFNNPGEILQIWKGGLSSHGAAIGVFLGYFIWTKVHQKKFIEYADLLVLGMPVTAAFVRIGNFINSEIVGKVTGVDYGVIFKKLGEDFPRHPAQLYEALLSLVIFAVMIFIFKKYRTRVKSLFFVFFYILTYFAGRFLIEFFKDVNSLPSSFVINTGQLLSLVPIILAAGYFIFYKKMGEN